MNIVRNPSIDVDVDLLRAVFPDLLPDGREIAHEQVEAVLKLSRLSARYRTVTAKWRRQVLRERSVYLDGLAAGGRGFVALTPDEMVRFANRGVREAGRKLRRRLQIAALPDDAQLSTDVRRWRGLLIIAVEKIAQEHRAQLMEVGRSLGRPARQLPRASGESGGPHV